MSTRGTPQTVSISGGVVDSPLPSPLLSPPDIPSEFSTASGMGARVRAKNAREVTDSTVVNEAVTRVNSAEGNPTSPVKGLGLGVVASLPAVIPPTHPARTLVLCFDGTGDQFDADNSNVVQFFSTLKKDDRRQQMVYYQAGIGTYTSPQVATPLATKLSKTLDEMIAWNLDAHVMGGYEFLMQNYEAGDKICIFGFSRGAYTARALAGMVHKVGLLPACNHQQVPFAYKMFSRTDEIGWTQSTAFKKAFSMDVDIEFIGVWDTVSSVGLFPKRLPFTTSNTAVKTFRHAVSLDERRAKFKANLFNRPTKEQSKLGVQPGEMPKSMSTMALDGLHALAEDDDGDGIKRKGEDSKKWQLEMEMERQFSRMEGNSLETDVLEVWFAGCHCDVGGGSVPNDTRNTLARIPLRWMIRQCFLTNTGIRFHTDLLRTVGLDPTSLYPVVKPRPPPLSSMPEGLRIPPKFTGSHKSHIRPRVGYASIDPNSPNLTEEEEDFADALCPLYDQLSLRKGWWILELIPIKHRVQKHDNSWTTERLMNLGRGRVVPHREHLLEPFYVHRSVKTRMEAQGLEGGTYVPNARFSVEPTWAD